MAFVPPPTTGGTTKKAPTYKSGTTIQPPKTSSVVQATSGYGQPTTATVIPAHQVFTEPLPITPKFDKIDSTKGGTEKMVLPKPPTTGGAPGYGSVGETGPGSARFGGGGYVSSTPGASIALQQHRAQGELSQYIRGLNQTLTATGYVREDGSILSNADATRIDPSFQNAAQLIAAGDYEAAYGLLPNYMTPGFATDLGWSLDTYMLWYDDNGQLRNYSNVFGGGGGAGTGSGGGSVGGFGGGGGGGGGGSSVPRPWRYGLINWRL